MRKAFDVPEDPYLPSEVLWRQKEQFSDGVGYNWWVWAFKRGTLPWPPAWWGWSWSLRTLPQDRRPQGPHREDGQRPRASARATQVGWRGQPAPDSSLISLTHLSAYTPKSHTGSRTTPLAQRRPTGTARCLSSTFPRGLPSRLFPADPAWPAPPPQRPC